MVSRQSGTVALVEGEAWPKLLGLKAWYGILIQPNTGALLNPCTCHAMMISGPEVKPI